jgi:hypothetical protein
MNPVTILVIVLLVLLLGGFAPWGDYHYAHFYGTGYYGGGLGLVLLILLVLIIAGKI